MLRTSARMHELQRRSASLEFSQQMDTPLGVSCSIQGLEQLTPASSMGGLDPSEHLSMEGLSPLSAFSPREEQVAITVQDWRRLVEEFTEQGAAQDHTFADVTFKFRDGDQNNSIDLAEFLTLAELLKFEMVGIDHDFSNHHQGWAADLCESHWFASGSTVAILFSCVLCISCAHKLLNPHSELSPVLPVMCYVLLCAEWVLRWVAYGPKACLMIWYNKLDTALSLAVAVLVIQGSFTEEGWTHWSHSKWFGLLVLRGMSLGRCSIWEKEHSLLWWAQRVLHWGSRGRVPDCWGSVAIRNFNLKLMSTATRTRVLFVHTGGLLFCVLYSFAVFGSLFGDVVARVDKEYSDDPVDRGLTNFSDIGHSLIAMFQILMSNNWNDILYTAAAGCGAFVKPFFVVVFVVLVFIMLNIFTSIVLQSFDVNEVHSDLRHTGEFSCDAAAPKQGYLYIAMPGDCCYRLQRRHNQHGFELHMDLMDATKAELLSDCLQGDNMFLTVLTESEQEIVAGTARFPRRRLMLLLLLVLLLAGGVIGMSANSCSCRHNPGDC
eukprot:TRINITY_DN17130_c0_g1_i2.p1 TRINITY_DN17130_c0_g1~~TRINITY_DN17130_c0_g1_i2.p1  ORF type:complete len:548 (-),score=156.11 TRINITY_DN17130_c0_g1_i2:10-1653(-)